jgi:hypothetical protein
VLWSISKPALDSPIIRQNVAAAHKRALYPFFLPTGVEMQDMEKVWHDMQFNPAAPVDVPFKAELFCPAPKSVLVLRELSRQGQSYLDCTARAQEGRDKHVLGLPNDAREMAPLLADAHGDLGSGPLSAPSIGEGSSRPVGCTITPGPPADSQYFEGTGEQVTSSVMAAATDQEQEWAEDAVPPMITSLPGTNARSGDFVSESTVVHLEEMLSDDQRRMVQDTAGGQMTAVRPSPARRIFSRSGAAERNSKSLGLIKDLKKSLRDADKAG